MDKAMPQSIKKDLSRHDADIVFVGHSLPHLCIPLIPDHFTTQMLYVQVTVGGNNILLLKDKRNTIYQEDGNFCLLHPYD